MAGAIERELKSALAGGSLFLGQIAITPVRGKFVLRHGEDVGRGGLRFYDRPEEALALAKFDDHGNYRPLKTAPNLARGWVLELENVSEVCQALDCFYPGRLAALSAAGRGQLPLTPLRETLARQSGMYRVAAEISDAQIDEVVAYFCTSGGGCLRKILWRRDAAGTIPSDKLPPEKYEAKMQPGMWPLLCPEACNLLVAECRKVVKTKP